MSPPVHHEHKARGQNFYCPTCFLMLTFPSVKVNITRSTLSVFVFRLIPDANSSLAVNSITPNSDTSFPVKKRYGFPVAFAAVLVITVIFAVLRFFGVTGSSILKESETLKQSVPMSASISTKQRVILDSAGKRHLVRPAD